MDIPFLLSIVDKVSAPEYQVYLPNESTELFKGHDEYTSYIMNNHKREGVYPFIFELCKSTKPKHVVELGSREGMSTICFFEGIRERSDSLFTTIDINNDLRFVPEYTKTDPRVDYIFGDCLASTTLSKFQNKPLIDVILMDTIHTKEQLEAEWTLYEPYFNDICFVLIDDIYYDTKHVFFNTIKHEKFEDRRLHGSGFGVVIYRR